MKLDATPLRLGYRGFWIREAHHDEAGTFADYLCERAIGVSR